jgi:hypothetical protein
VFTFSSFSFRPSCPCARGQPEAGTGDLPRTSLTIRCLFVVGACRAYSYWRRQGYVPYDPSGDWAFVIIEGSGIAGSLYAAYASRQEKFAPPPGDFLIITSGAFLMGMAFHAVWKSIATPWSCSPRRQRRARARRSSNCTTSTPSNIG